MSRPPLLHQNAATTAMYNSAAHAGAFIGLARAKVDFTPPEGDTDSLTYKVSAPEERERKKKVRYTGLV